MNTLQDTLTVWKALEAYHPHQIRNIGIANTSLPVLQAVCSDQTAIGAAVVQNRFHNRTAFDLDLRKFCRDRDIVYQSFWTITANRQLLLSSPVRQVAEAVGVGQVPAYYSLVLGLGGTTVLDGTTNESHMREDLGGLEKVGLWAEGPGSSEWDSALREFRGLVGGS